jgi:NAD(P)-dependent dehydrogenase (short-subunit alcohol dehydrogenase family)
VESFAFDLTKDDDCDAVLKSALGTFKADRLDVLVNCAGVLQGGATGVATMENWDFNMNTNARAAFCLMTKAVPFMERTDGKTASVVNVSSVNGLQSFGGVVAYCASKAAVDMMTDCAAVSSVCILDETVGATCFKIYHCLFGS